MARTVTSACPLNPECPREPGRPAGRATDLLKVLKNGALTWTSARENGLHGCALRHAQAGGPPWRSVQARPSPGVV